MSKTTFTVLMLGSLITLAHAASAADAKAEKLGKKMVKNCKAELAAAPALADFSDPEAVWSNLESKEKAGELSAKCDAAEEQYEKQFHPDIWKAEEAKEKKN